MLRNKTTYFLPFCFFEMDENTKKIVRSDAGKRKTKEKTGGFIGKVLKKHHFKLRKSNKIIFVFKN